jgi:hypothetical protein
MLTLPNILTLSRILAVPLLVFLLWKPSWIDYAITFVLYCLVGITDYFDGYLARAQGTVSRLGVFLDPIADKIMVAAVIVMLISSRRQASGEPVIHDSTSSRRWSSCCARSSSRAFANSWPAFRSRCRSAARQVEDDLPAGRARRADPRRRGAAMAGCTMSASPARNSFSRGLPLRQMSAMRR